MEIEGRLGTNGGGINRQVVSESNQRGALSRRSRCSEKWGGGGRLMR